MSKHLKNFEILRKYWLLHLNRFSFDAWTKLHQTLFEACMPSNNCKKLCAATFDRKSQIPNSDWFKRWIPFWRCSMWLDRSSSMWTINLFLLLLVTAQNKQEWTPEGLLKETEQLAEIYHNLFQRQKNGLWTHNVMFTSEKVLKSNHLISVCGLHCDWMNKL